MPLQERKSFDHSPWSFDLYELARLDLVRAEHGRIFASLRCLEAIGEALAQEFACRLVEIDVDAAARVIRDHAQIIDAVTMVGVLVGVEHAVEQPDAGIDQLLAEVGRRIDQHARCAPRVCALRQNGAAPAPVLGIIRIACAPLVADARHAAGRAAAEDGDLERHAVPAC
jgi:hypothetical protein